MNNKKYFVLVFIISIIAVSILIAENKSSQNLFYEPQKVELVGVLKSKIFYGPPNYGENPKTDTKEYCFALHLMNPINVIAAKDDGLNETHLNVTNIQVIKKQNMDLKLYKDKKVKISGTLFSAVTGHHYTKVLINAEKIVKLK